MEYNMANVELYHASKRLEQALNDLKRLNKINAEWHRMAQTSTTRKEAVSCQK